MGTELRTAMSFVAPPSDCLLIRSEWRRERQSIEHSGAENTDVIDPFSNIGEMPART